MLKKLKNRHILATIRPVSMKFEKTALIEVLNHIGS